MNIIIKELERNKKFLEFISDIERKKGPILLSGLNDVVKTQIIAGTEAYSKRPILVITYNELQAKKLVQDLKYLNKNI